MTLSWSQLTGLFITCLIPVSNAFFTVISSVNAVTAITEQAFLVLNLPIFELWLTWGNQVR
jgi:hypothetical protein